MHLKSLVLLGRFHCVYACEGCPAGQPLLYLSHAPKTICYYYHYCFIAQIFTELLCRYFIFLLLLFQNVSQGLLRAREEYLTQALFYWTGFDPNLPVLLPHSLSKQSYLQWYSPASSKLDVMLFHPPLSLSSSSLLLSIHGFSCSVDRCPLPETVSTTATPLK